MWYVLLCRNFHASLPDHSFQTDPQAGIAENRRQLPDVIHCRCFPNFNIGSFPVFAVSGFFNYLLVVLLVIGKRKRETPDCCLAHFPDKEEWQLPEVRQHPCRRAPMDQFNHRRSMWMCAKRLPRGGKRPRRIFGSARSVSNRFWIFGRVWTSKRRRQEGKTCTYIRNCFNSKRYKLAEIMQIFFLTSFSCVSVFLQKDVFANFHSFTCRFYKELSHIQIKKERIQTAGRKVNIWYLLGV